MSKFFSVIVMFVSIGASAASISNFDHIRRTLGFHRLTEDLGRVHRPVRVAILDKAFSGLRREIGRSLPASTVYVPGSIATPDGFKSDHGVRMAQIVSALVTEDLEHSKRLELRLFNTFGFTNFSEAVRGAIQWKADVILYSEVWEYGGNIDGGGFINAQVDRATRAGILWINAAGNFGRTTYNGPIHTGQDDWLRLPDQNRALKLICRAKRGQKCGVKIVLSWNDFKDDPEAGTNKDLDFALTDDLLNVIQSSALKQSADRRENRPGYSKYPREIIATELKPGTYFVRVKQASENFDSEDRLRITVDGESIDMPSAQPEDSILVPADHPDVLTVGASDSDRSGRSGRLGKPDLLAPSSLKLDDNSEFRGSSNAAAFTAAAAALLKLNGELLSKDLLLQRSARFSWDHGQISLGLLRFSPVGGCFAEVQGGQPPAHVQRILEAGGKLVQTTAGMRIMLPYDPMRMFTSLRRSRPDDMIVITPQGPAVVPRMSPAPNGAVEIFARPLEVGLCRRPTPASGYVLGF